MGGSPPVCSGGEKHTRLASENRRLCQQNRNPVTANQLSTMHSQGKSARLRIRLSPELKDRLRVWADRNDKTLSAYTRQVLQEKINDEILSDIDRKL